MQINVNSSSIIQELFICSSVASGKQAIPILSDVLFCTDAKNNTATMTVSDSEIWATLNIQNVQSEKDTKFCVGIDHMLDVLRNLDNETDISITLNEQNKTLKLSYGKGYVIMPYLESDEYPQPKYFPVNNFEINSAKVMSAIKKVLFAVDVDVLRPIISSVLFDISDDKMTTVGTNIKKLIKHSKRISGNNDGYEKSFALPIKASNILYTILSKRNDQRVWIGTDDKMLCVTGDDFKFVCALQVGKYPNYNSIIPKEYKYKAIINKICFVGAIRRVKQMGADDSISLAFIPNTVVVAAEDSAMGKNASEKITCNNNCNGFEIIFSFEELLPVVNNIEDDEIAMYFNSEKSAAIITASNEIDGEKTISLVMPLASL